MSKNLYETLGVNPDATPAELKVAYRALADRMHPDKGGDHEAFTEVTRAYRILKDPEKRKLYDETGMMEITPEEDRLRGVVFQAFMDALAKDAPNIVEGAKRFLAETKANIQKQRDEGQRALDSLLARRDKVTTKSAENAFHMLVDQHVVQIKQKIATFDIDLDITEKAEKELKKYKSSEKLLVTPSQMWGGTGTTGGQW